MDPEACRNKRANIEWGEEPPHWPSDVGSVTVQGGKVAFLPGEHGVGKLLVLAPNPPVSFQVGTEEPLMEPQINRMHRVKGVTIRLQPGPVLIQTDSVAQRMGLPNDEGHDEDQIEALRQLGYVD